MYTANKKVIKYFPVKHHFEWHKHMKELLQAFFKCDLSYGFCSIWEDCIDRASRDSSTI